MLEEPNLSHSVWTLSSKMLSHSYFQISKRTELYSWPLHLHNYMLLFISYIVYQQFLITNRYSPMSIWPNQIYSTSNYVIFMSKMCSISYLNIPPSWISPMEVPLQRSFQMLFFKEYIPLHYVKISWIAALSYQFPVQRIR